MLRPASLLLTAVFVVATCDALLQPAPVPGAIAGDMTAALAAKPLPAADLFDLTRRLKGQDGTPAAAFQAARQRVSDEAVGAVAPFWTYDFDAKKNVKVSAILRVLGEHAKWWVADDVTVDPAALRTTAGVFDTRIYPADRAAYGTEWSPGIDADPRINVLIARIPGRAAGYFSSADEYPLWVNAYSAEREMIYVNAMSARLATDNLYSVLAHEFCHMIQFNKRARSIVWFNEGQAQLCERLNNVASQFEVSFLRQPDTQLNDWPDLDDTAILHYGGSLLFLEWLQRHAGGDDLINALMAHGVDTPNDIDAVLKQRGQPGMDEQFADFVAANALIGPDAPDRYSYKDLRLGLAATATSQDRLVVPGDLRATVHEYAARYVALPQSPVHLTFSGPTATRLIPTDPHSGRAMWWSDRADGLDSSLTRQVDLRNVTKATLSFWSWYEIEKDFDYAYVAVSTDGGARWTTLRTDATTADDPNGNNLGNGLTGTSGGTSPSWVKQAADLTPYAGKQVQLRFEYVTDGALNLNGLAIDDIAIPEIGYSDDAESDNGWTPSGFIRSTNVVKQRFVVQVIRFGATPTVERHFVADGLLELDVDGSTDRKPPLLAVTGLAPRTTGPVAFTLRAVAK
ncbi:MAG TPA: choice-of-anchor J domain-containing protein [Candidatus Limnocylindria bacterium]|nr:choice-of-anchor J domain-containing protein [Candidatus Limnocylindria bacterium]